MLTQTQYRFGRAEGTESTHSWLAGPNRQVFRIPGVNGDCLLRVSVQADETGVSDLALTWEYRLTTFDANGDPVVGDWTAVPNDTSGACRAVTAGVLTNGADCTKRLSGTGTFTTTNSGCTTDGTAGGVNNTVAANGNTESEIGLRITGGNTLFGDSLEVRVTQGGVPLDQYGDLPLLRVAKNVLADGTYTAGELFTSSTSVNKIRGAVLSYFGRLSDTDVADPSLTITMNVMGTTDPQSGVYDIPIYGPDTWQGGLIGKDGLPIYPQMVFAGTTPNGVRKVRASFAISRDLTFSIDAGLVEGFASGRIG